MDPKYGMFDYYEQSRLMWFSVSVSVHLFILNHYLPELHFYTPRNHSKTYGFWTFSGVLEMEYLLNVGKYRLNVTSLADIHLLISFVNVTSLDKSRSRSPLIRPCFLLKPFWKMRFLMNQSYHWRRRFI